MIRGQIVKEAGGRFFVKTDDGERMVCSARGKLKEKGELYVGDIVFVDDDGSPVIEKLAPRESMLVRPYVSNIDGIIIVLAVQPRPDFLLADKMIVGCVQQQLDAIVCVNKCDLDGSDELVAKVKTEYGAVADVVPVCAADGTGMQVVREMVKGRFFCLAGQSAVGKSSMINALYGGDRMAVGGLGKNLRGRHTTRHVEIIELGDGTKIADTCGFSRYEIPLVDPATLSGCYVDFDEYRNQCRFRGCTHTVEECCGVKEAVAEGKLPEERYQRYLALYDEMSRRWEKRYG